MAQALVILNYNGLSPLEKYLPSVLDYSPNWDIYVADNASTDGSLDFLKEKFPQIKRIELSQNFGFAAGYNEALKTIQDQYEFYFILNSDVRLSPNWDTPLLEYLAAHPETAAVQPKVLADRQPTHFEHAGAAGGYLDNFYFPFCRGRIMHVCEPDELQYQGPQQVTWTSGAAMLIRAHDFHLVGGFDAHFFAHMEEIDLCLRLAKEGKSCYCIPAAVVWHYGGATLDYDNPRKLYLNFRNSLWMLVKNQQRFMLVLLFFRMLLDGIAAIQFLLKGKPALTWQIFLAHMALYRHFGRNYRLRKKSKFKVFKYHGLIIWDFYGKQIKAFSQLNKRKFHS
jgi:hypothetical protein